METKDCNFASPPNIDNLTYGVFKSTWHKIHKIHPVSIQEGESLTKSAEINGIVFSQSRWLDSSEYSGPTHKNIIKVS